MEMFLVENKHPDGYVHAPGHLIVEMSGKPALVERATLQLEDAGWEWYVGDEGWAVLHKQPDVGD